MDKNANTEEEQPWNKFLIPDPKSKQLIYFNSLTEQIYKSAYVGRQSGFQAYLNGQRKFRWEVLNKIKNFEKDMLSYKEGIIPKENIDYLRYQEYPDDVKINDVAKCRRALDHFNGSLASSQAAQKQLNEKRKHLYNAEMKPKSWASNELTFIETHMEGITNFIREVQKLADNCQHTLTLLEKRYNAADVSASERKRKLKRKKEQRSKLRRKQQKKLAARKTAEVSDGSSSDPEESADDNSDNDTN